MNDYNEMLISQAGGDGDHPKIRVGGRAFGKNTAREIRIHITTTVDSTSSNSPLTHSMLSRRQII